MEIDRVSNLYEDGFSVFEILIIVSGSCSRETTICRQMDLNNQYKYCYRHGFYVFESLRSSPIWQVVDTISNRDNNVNLLKSRRKIIHLVNINFEKLRIPDDFQTLSSFCLMPSVKAKRYDHHISLRVICIIFILFITNSDHISELRKHRNAILDFKKIFIMIICYK